MSSGTVPSWGASGASGENPAGHEGRLSKKITQSLERLRSTMEVNVSAASNAVSLLEEDGTAILETLDTQKHELKSALVSTSSRLSRVQHAEWREKVAVFGSLLFFTSTVVYIIAKRIRLLTLVLFSLQGLFPRKTGGGHREGPEVLSPLVDVLPEVFFVTKVDGSCVDGCRDIGTSFAFEAEDVVALSQTEVDWGVGVVVGVEGHGDPLVDPRRKHVKEEAPLEVESMQMADGDDPADGIGDTTSRISVIRMNMDKARALDYDDAIDGDRD